MSTLSKYGRTLSHFVADDSSVWSEYLHEGRFSILDCNYDDRDHVSRIHIGAPVKWVRLIKHRTPGIEHDAVEIIHTKRHSTRFVARGAKFNNIRISGVRPILGGTYLGVGCRSFAISNMGSGTVDGWVFQITVHTSHGNFYIFMCYSSVSHDLPEVEAYAP